MTWREVALGDHVELATGFPFKSAEFENESDGASRLLRGDNIGQGTLRWDGARHWPASKASDYAAMQLRVGDVVLAMDRPWVTAGLKWAVVKNSDLPALLVQRVARLRAKRGVSQAFLPYILASEAFTNHVQAITTGVNVPHISGRDIRSFRFHIPSADEQRRIASILSAYDDLIEANRRRVAILEEMARRLFEEWFVHLRFPGHATTPLHDAPDGPVPEGWRRVPLADLASYINRGIAPSYDESASTLVLSQKCIRDGRLSLGPSRRQSRRPPPEKIVQPGDVLINSTGAGTLGRVAQAENVPLGLTVDSHVTIIRPRANVDRDFLGSAIGRMQATFEQLGTGSTNQTELSRGAIASVELLVPTPELLETFGKLVRPSRALQHKLAEQNTRLAAARDLLLPRLLSGQLSVSAEQTPELLAAAE